jgi:hypothetical protein
MFVFLEELFDAIGHQNVEFLCSVTPVKFDSAIEIARPIFGKFVLLLYALYEVVRMFLTYIFHPKIVNYQGKGDWPCLMFP